MKGIYEAPPFWQMLGVISIPTATFDGVFEIPRNLYTFVNTSEGATPEVQQALETPSCPSRA